MTPDGTPVVGATPVAQPLLATGHGTLGWTMAAGTGGVMADVISGRAPEIDLAGLTIARYRRGRVRPSGEPSAAAALKTTGEREIVLARERVEGRQRSPSAASGRGVSLVDLQR